jgi:restriction system protein
MKSEVGTRVLLTQPALCPCCGWWSVYRVHQGEHPESPDFECYAGAIGCLRELDIGDISIPLAEVRRYIAANNARLIDVHPRTLEHLVCSVFKDLGFHARVTAYSADGGIDVILDGPSTEVIGVQVKRYKKGHPIEAEPIRALAGALMTNGLTEGIFITTSSFRKGAWGTAERLTSLGYPIKLMDAERFLEALGIAQLSVFDLDRVRIISYLKSKCVHIGSGARRRYKDGENLFRRQPIITTFTRDDLLDSSSQQHISSLNG